MGIRALAIPIGNRDGCLMIYSLMIAKRSPAPSAYFSAYINDRVNNDTP